MPSYLRKSSPMLSAICPLKPFPTYNKSAADDFEKSRKINGNSFEMKVYILNKVENITAKGEITHYEQFLLFQQCFQKSSAANASVSWKGLTFFLHFETVHEV